MEKRIFVISDLHGQFVLLQLLLERIGFTDDDELYKIPGTPPNLAHEVVGDAFAPRNQFALNIDRRVEPPMFDVPGSSTHKVASWLMHEKAPKVEMPESLKHRIDKMKKEGL